jgi:hypothetical protein
MSKLAGLQFSVQYKRGVDNKAVDALSRVASEIQLTAISVSTPVWIQEVLKSYEMDPHAQDLLKELAVQSPNAQGFSLNNGLIYRQQQLVVGQNVGLHTKLIAAFHSSAMGGHSGVFATYQRLKKLFYWPGQKTDVELFVKQCQICQQAKHEHCKYPGLLQPLPIPQHSWQDLSMDFVEGLPKSGGYTVILVVVDRLTKYAHFIPVKHPFTASQIAQLFFTHIVKLHGLPRSIVSDRDKIFTSTLWQELFRLAGTKLHLSSAYHPQSDGQTERINQCLEMFLRCAVHQTPSQWSKWLDSAELWYNSCYHSSLKCSPFKALYGVEPNWGVLPDSKMATVSEVQLTLQQRQDFLEVIKANLASAQNRMKHYADTNRTPRQFQVGDMAFLKLQPFAQSSVHHRPCAKLSFKYFGPFQILEKIGTAAYRLQLPPSAVIHPVFHVSQLKPHVPNNVPVFADIPPPSSSEEVSPVPESILDRRLVRKGAAAVTQVLIKWQGVPTEMSSWEDYTVVRARFPSTTI